MWPAPKQSASPELQSKPNSSCEASSSLTLPTRDAHRSHCGMSLRAYPLTKWAIGESAQMQAVRTYRRRRKKEQPPPCESSVLRISQTSCICMMNRDDESPILGTGRIRRSQKEQFLYFAWLLTHFPGGLKMKRMLSWLCGTLLVATFVPMSHADPANSLQALSFTLTCGNAVYSVVSPSQKTPTELIVGSTNVSIPAVVVETISLTDSSGQPQTFQETFVMDPAHGNASACKALRQRARAVPSLSRANAAR
jgi:hypothetical protein